LLAQAPEACMSAVSSLPHLYQNINTDA